MAPALVSRFNILTNVKRELHCLTSRSWLTPYVTHWRKVILQGGFQLSSEQRRQLLPAFLSSDFASHLRSLASPPLLMLPLLSTPATISLSCLTKTSSTAQSQTEEKITSPGCLQRGCSQHPWIPSHCLLVWGWQGIPPACVSPVDRHIPG